MARRSRWVLSCEESGSHIRNGLYILRYTGPHAVEVADIRFLEGNSNLADTVRLARGGG